MRAHVGQVLGPHPERALQRPRPAHEQAADVVGCKQPLVRIEHQRVGALDAAQRAAARLAQRRRRPVGAVDVEPQRLGGRQLGQALQLVDRAGVGRPGRGHDEPRVATLAAILVDRVTHRRRGQAQAVVAGQRPARRRVAKPSASQPAADRGVRLVRHVGDAGPDRVARRGERGHVRQRPAAHQQALRCPPGRPSSSRSQSTATSSTVAVSRCSRPRRRDRVEAGARATRRARRHTTMARAPWRSSGGGRRAACSPARRRPASASPPADRPARRGPGRPARRAARAADPSRIAGPSAPCSKCSTTRSTTQ